MSCSVHRRKLVPCCYSSTGTDVPGTRNLTIVARQQCGFHIESNCECSRVAALQKAVQVLEIAVAVGKPDPRYVLPSVNAGYALSWKIEKARRRLGGPEDSADERLMNVMDIAYGPYDLATSLHIMLIHPSPKTPKTPTLCMSSRPLHYTYSPCRNRSPSFCLPNW